MVIPIIDYCSLVLMDISKRLDYKLQRLINNGIKFIFNLKRDEHITPHRRSLQWLTVKSKRYYFLACFLYKLFNSGEHKFLRSMF
ncbi:GSCOCG00008903001-RA-CDS, partial [Cotesia congregata]